MEDIMLLSSPDQLESIKKELFTFAMEGEWQAVVKMYEEEPWVHKARETRSGDTALHKAVSDAEEEVVKQIVGILTLQHRKEALQTENERGNIALHIATSMGNAKMCEMIASVYPLLVDCRNVDGETPLFLAALHGRKQAFLCLHWLRNPDSSVRPKYDNCTRKRGDTILHCAINGDHFDLAFQIIHLYKELVTWVNPDGLSPLHLLAAKPSAFRSGSRLGRNETIIYHCIFVEDLKVADPWRSQTADKADQAIHQYFPDNHNRWWDIFSVIKSTVTAVVGKGDESQAKANDPEEAKNYYTAAKGSEVEAQERGSFPANYRTCCFDMVKYFYLGLLVILGGSSELNKIRRKKEKHTWSVKIMNALLYYASDYEHNGKRDVPIPKDSVEKDSEESKKDTPILIAAKNGIMEMVKEILRLSPKAINDVNEEKKNIVLLAVEHRQRHIYQLLLEKNFFKESLFRQVDNEGNSALHLAAKLGPHKPWRLPGPALQMHWEIKWFMFVRCSVPVHFFVQYNEEDKTPIQIFTETHKELVESGREWVVKTAEALSVMGAAIGTVTFATSATVPGGVDQQSGLPTLKMEPAFNVFAISSLMALSFSVTSVVMSLSILFSRFKDSDFWKDIPKKVILSVTFLLMSFVPMLMSFFAAHFFLLKDQLQHAAFPIYALAALPLMLSALAQLPLYFEVVRVTFNNVPSSRSNEDDSLQTDEGIEGLK